MKKYFKNYSVIMLVISILFFILGAVMYTKPEFIVLVFSYVMGGLIILFGIYYCIKNYVEIKNNKETSSKDMIVGITLVVVGLIFIFLANVIEALVRLIIGGYILFIGITRFVNSLYMKKDTRFFVSLGLSLLLIAGGLYTILEANLAFQTIGIVIMAYSVIEIIGFIFNHDNNEVIVSEKVLIEEKKSDKKTDI
ncbi:MAG: DUF308 domain-containing protein [Erysipelotrichaceae bacterium]|nr:DUF308 domain-containing protein [Erysipelotrichaceae bacterium]